MIVLRVSVEVGWASWFGGMSSPMLPGEGICTEGVKGCSTGYSRSWIDAEWVPLLDLR